MEHDLTLARAELVEALLERSQYPFTLPAGTIASETGLHSVKQILITEWLCEELYGAALHRLHGHRHVGMRCDEDDQSRSRKSGRDDKWNFCLTTAIVAVNRRDHEETTPPEPLSGLQGEGGSGRRQGRPNDSPAGRAFRRSPQSDHGLEIAA